MPVIGTGGHVDHGKSSLIIALTGRDPDRWVEEKRRGMTIDLGFSWMNLADGTEISFVDVPGHHRFLRNMLAGTTGIDVGLLVVAADEGWMPQTEEHLAVFDLAGIRRVVVVVTKSDIVEPARLSEVAAQARCKLESTSFEGDPIVSVSSVTGVGLTDLVAAISEAVDGVSTIDNGRPRLWVDRSFSMPGVGTVVTGTLTGGSIRTGDTVSLWPDLITARVRTLQSHQAPAETFRPGRRVAIGLVGVEREAAGRGTMIGKGAQWSLSQRTLVNLKTARYIKELPERGAYQFHIGTGHTLGSFRYISTSSALLTLSTPSPLQMGDRMIIRDVGRSLVVGAAYVLDPAPAQRVSDLTLTAFQGIDELQPDERATLLLEIRAEDSMNRLAAHTGGGTPESGIIVGDQAVSNARIAELTDRGEQLISKHHERHPLKRGMQKAQLASKLGISIAILDQAIKQSAKLTSEHELVALDDHQPKLAPEQANHWVLAKASLSDIGKEIPKASELGISEDVIDHLTQNGDLVRISPELVLLPEQVAGLLDVLESLSQPFTVSDFRQAASLTRKYAVPFLEWADANGVTRRYGDHRTRIM